MNSIIACVMRNTYDYTYDYTYSNQRYNKVDYNAHHDECIDAHNNDLSYESLTKEYKNTSWMYYIISGLRKILSVSFVCTAYISFALIYPNTSLFLRYFAWCNESHHDNECNTKPLPDDATTINHINRFSIIILIVSILQYSLIIILIIEQVMLHKYKKYKYHKALSDLRYGVQV